MLPVTESLQTYDKTFLSNPKSNNGDASQGEDRFGLASARLLLELATRLRIAEGSTNTACYQLFQTPLLVEPALFCSQGTGGVKGCWMGASESRRQTAGANIRIMFDNIENGEVSTVWGGAGVWTES